MVTDPIFSHRCSPSQLFGPARFRPAPCQVDDLPSVDICLLSHAHYDHFDVGSLRALAQSHHCHFYVPLGLKQQMLSFAGRENVTELDWWESAEHWNADGDRVKVTAIPAQHWSRRGLFDTNTSLWCGFVVESGRLGQKVCFVGDTGYCPVFKDIGAELGPFDLSLIPIGAYEPIWFMKAQHVNPEEAYEIHKDLRSKRSLGIHHGTFRLTSEAVQEPREKFLQLVKTYALPEKSLFTLHAGEHVEIEKMP